MSRVDGPVVLDRVIAAAHRMNAARDRYYAAGKTGIQLCAACQAGNPRRFGPPDEDHFTAVDELVAAKAELSAALYEVLAAEASRDLL
jgi:hypothetical protein